MIEKLKGHTEIRIIPHRGSQEIEYPPTNWEIMAKVNEIIEHINEMEK